MAQLTPIPALAPTDLDGIAAFLDEYGFALVRGLYEVDLLAALDQECADAQARLGRRELSDRDLIRYGTDVLDDPDAHAARATVDGEAGIRRHLRGGWSGGERIEEGHGLDDFVKNAAR